MRFLDKTITCNDCRRQFPYSAEKQGLHRELGFDTPTRCFSCQKSREDQRRGARDDGGYPLGLLSPMIAAAPTRYQSN